MQLKCSITLEVKTSDRYFTVAFIFFIITNSVEFSSLCLYYENALCKVLHFNYVTLTFNQQHLSNLKIAKARGS